MTEKIASFMLPCLILAFSVLMYMKKEKGVGTFTHGAKEGIKLAYDILPTLVILMVGVAVFNKSGLCALISEKLAPIGEKIGIPKEVLPLVIIRPFSGSGSSAVLIDLFEKEGVDSFASTCACVLFGSSETLLYVITVYFGAVGIKKTRYAIPCAVITMIFCIILTFAVSSRLL